MKFAKVVTQILIGLGPALYVIGTCLLLCAWAYVVMVSLVTLKGWGVPDILAFLLSYLVIPLTIAFPFMGLGMWLNDRYDIQARAKDWVYYCTTEKISE